VIYTFITLKDLQEHRACNEGQEEFKTNFPDGIDVYELVKKLEERKDSNSYIFWLFITFNLTGICKYWHNSGQLAFEDNFKNGRQHGICKSWDKNGKLEYEFTYEDGRLLTDEE